MALIIELTQLSPTMTEGTFVKWIKQPGESVSPGDILAEVETDKAVMEMEAYDAGVLLAQISAPGDKLPVGAPMGILGAAGEDIASILEQAHARLKQANSKQEKPAVVQRSAPEHQVKEPKVEPSAEPVLPKAEPRRATVAAPHTGPARTGRILASPLARKIASEQGVNIAEIPGSGPKNRIQKSDVLNYIQQSINIQPGIGSKPDERIEISNMRKVIAQRLHDSKSNIPHFYLKLEFDAKPMDLFRRKLTQDIAALYGESGPKITYNDLIVKACALTLREHPICNSSWAGDHIVQRGSIDIGIAVAIDGGLITPYVRNADQLPLLSLASQIRQLAAKAKERKLKPEEYTNGTFTISNLGMFGITEFSAIINEPEAAIMAVGGIFEKPVIENGTIVPGKTMTVTLSCDHRVIDGAEGARFLQTFKNFIEHPHLLAVS